MNYKVMQRPMFKLGGKVASQGTGITSGLDTKANYSIGGGVIKGQNMNGREGFQDPNYGGMSIKELIDLQNANQDKQMSGLSDMRDIIKLQAVGNLVGNVLPNIESGGFRAVTDFFKDPMTTQAALEGLTGLKKVDLKEKELQGSKLDKYITQRMGLQQLDISEKRALQETATALKDRLAEEARNLIATYGSVSQMPPEIQAKYYDNRKIATGDMTPQEAIVLATRLVQADSEKYAERTDTKGFKPEEFKKKVDELAAMFLGNAMGGTPNRVERQMGSPMMGEQPMQQEMVTEQQDVAMETQGDQGNKVYAMLRARLPQEVSDEVVKLIAYNKEAFGDFASIKNQEDVNSFNEKYGVQLVIDMATV
jgi:hypothetical protein